MSQAVVCIYIKFYMLFDNKLNDYDVLWGGGGEEAKLTFE